MLLLSGTFIACAITSVLLGSYLIQIFGVPFSMGIFALPVTYLATDLISEVYGFRVARRVVFVGILLQLVPLLFITLATQMTPYHLYDNSEAFGKMFALAPRMVLGSMSAYAVAQFFDVYIFERMHRITGKRHLWLRNNASTMISQGIDSATFLLVYLGGIVPVEDLASKFLIVYTFKVIMAAVDTPFVYLGRALIYRLDRGVKIH